MTLTSFPCALDRQIYLSRRSFKLPQFAWGSEEALPENALGNVIKELVKKKLLDSQNKSVSEVFPDEIDGSSVRLNPLYTNSTPITATSVSLIDSTK